MSRLEYLSDRCISGLATSEELLELQNLMAAPENEKEARTLIHAGYLSVSDLKDINENTSREILSAIVEADKMLSLKTGRTAMIRRFRWIAAASVILIATLGLYLITNRTNPLSDGENIATATKLTDVEPGREGAILTLADGTRLVLDSMNNGIINAGSEALLQLSDGLLAYNDSLINSINSSTAYHTLTTPKGRQFTLQLPDGSRVWLNAASSIKFPVSFSNLERRVEITGEAYFEVASKHSRKNQLAQQKIPFIVETKRQTIEVLGTHFNVNAYEDELVEKTTLLEGAVQIKATNLQGLHTEGVFATGLVLTPGQQAITTNDAGIETENAVDIDKVMAWKNGLFHFADLKLEEAMRQISRWYNIEIVYEGAIPEIEFWGKMGRDLSLNDVLRFLDKSGVHFRIENGKKLIVKNQT